jgi:hypothetical protein
MESSCHHFHLFLLLTSCRSTVPDQN